MFLSAFIVQDTESLEIKKLRQDFIILLGELGK